MRDGEVHSDRAIRGNGLNQRPDSTNLTKETMTLHKEHLERETKFARIAKKARGNPDEVFTSLAHYLSVEFLINSYRKLRKSAAPGMDG